MGQGGAGQPQPLPLQNPAVGFTARDWSPDGDWLAGDLSAPDGTSLGLARIEMATGRIEQLTEFGSHPVWLSDARRLLFAASRQIWLLDLETGESRAILGRPPDLVAYPRLRADDREIGTVLASTEADIWLLTID